MSVKWIAKAIVQKTISFLPNPERVNLLFQQYVTKGVELSDEHFGYKITHARDHINYFNLNFWGGGGTFNRAPKFWNWVPAGTQSFL